MHGVGRDFGRVIVWTCVALLVVCERCHRKNKQTESSVVGRRLNLSDMGPEMWNLTLRLSPSEDVDAEAEAYVQGCDRGLFEADGVV